MALALGALFAPGAAQAERREPDVIVVGELIRGRSHGTCGVQSVVGEYEFRVVSVQRGELAAKRIVVEVLCPSGSFVAYPLSRLELSSRRLYPYRPSHPLKDPPSERFYLIEQQPHPEDYPALLGLPIAQVDQRFTYVSTSEGWRHYGTALDVAVQEGLVHAIRFRCPPGFPRSFPWAGLPTVTWSRYRRHGGFSEGQFTAPGLTATARRGSIELRRAP